MRLRINETIRAHKHQMEMEIEMESEKGKLNKKEAELETIENTQCVACVCLLRSINERVYNP